MERTSATVTNTSSDKMFTTTLVTNVDHDDSMDKSNHLDKFSIPHFFSNMEKEISEMMNIQAVIEKQDKLKSISTKYMSRCWVTDCLRTETENIFFKKEDIDGNNKNERILEKMQLNVLKLFPCGRISASRVQLWQCLEMFFQSLAFKFVMSGKFFQCNFR